MKQCNRTDEINRGKRGAGAGDPHFSIPRALAVTIYFNPKRQARADVSWFVALCNDDQPLFEPLSVNPREWVKQGDYPGEVPVNVLAISYNMLLACVHSEPLSEIVDLSRAVQPSADPEVNYFAAAHLAYCRQSSAAL